MAFLLRLLRAKKRHEIRKGKLWEISSLFGLDIHKIERQPVEGIPLERGEAMPVEKMRVHLLKPENNVTNLTKKADLL